MLIKHYFQVGPSLLVLGEVATKYGLGVSLLERLHKTYNDDTFIDASTAHCATLLKNYRCHHAIVSLPSYLFYNSALLTAGNRATSRLHPQAKYPLHFICSSLSDKQEVKDGINKVEVILLLNEVAKYVNDWPKNWGQKRLKNIGIIAVTINQV